MRDTIIIKLGLKIHLAVLLFSLLVMAAIVVYCKSNKLWNDHSPLELDVHRMSQAKVYYLYLSL